MKKLLTILVLMITCSPLMAQQSVDAGLAKGNDAYRKQEFDKAQDFYRKVLEKSPSNSTASYNLGNALYRDKKTEEAETESKTDAVEIPSDETPKESSES